MLKRISVQHLQLGMHIHKFCGAWMEHPFWRAGFLLKDPRDLAHIQATSLQEVWIDVSKGRDVPSGVECGSGTEAEVAAEAAAEAQKRREAELTPEALASHLPSQERDRTPASMEAELRAAAVICGHALETVASLYEDARSGRSVDTAAAQNVVDDISDSVVRNPCAITSLVRLKEADRYTYMHSVALCALMVGLSRQIGLDEDATRTAGLAGLLLDIGKARIPLAILHKPGKLTEREREVIESHPEEGWKILRTCKNLDEQVLDACLHHHEKVDGTGYPHRLAGEQIGQMARMAAICDVYDALTSNRPYKRGADPSEALRQMAELSQGHFDSRLFQAFVKSIGIYPVGSLVRLSSGRIGVVLEQSSSLLAPRVRVFYSAQSGLRIPPVVVELSPKSGEKIAAREDPAQWRFPQQDTIWSGLGAQPW